MSVETDEMTPSGRQISNQWKKWAELFACVGEPKRNFPPNGCEYFQLHIKKNWTSGWRSALRVKTLIAMEENVRQVIIFLYRFRTNANFERRWMVCLTIIVLFLTFQKNFNK